MIKALMLIFAPVQAWEGIIRAQRSVLYIIAGYLLPLLLLTSVAEGYGLMRWGEPQRVVTFVKIFTLAEAMAYEAVQIVLSLVVVLVSSYVVRNLGETFHGRHTFKQAFTAVAYGLSPFFLLRLIDAFTVSPWVAWGAGILLAAVVLYHGVPRVMDPDPAHSFGLYLMSALLLVMTTGLVRFLTAWYLQGRFALTESAFVDFVDMATRTFIT